MEKKINIIKELRDISKIFGKHGHGNTSKWITFIADNLENDFHLL